MSIMDAQLVFCESQSIAGTAGTNTDSVDVIQLPQVLDHKNAAMNDRPNVSGRLCLNIVVEDENLAAAANNCDLTFRLYHHTAPTGITAAGKQVLEHVIAVAQVSNYPDGTKICSIPLPIRQLEPYLILNAARATQALSTGKITAWIGPAAQEG